MKKYSITKYNNKNMNSWTSISDIGKKYGEIELSLDIYKKTEDSYVNAILLIIEYLKIETFKVENVFRWKNLEKEIEEDLYKKDIYTKEMMDLYHKLESNSFINKFELCDLVRLELREDIGGLITTPYKLKIFIGYDYMMGIHSSKSIKALFEPIENLGLNIFCFK